jgi:integral membrane protein (TIGR01906 family)
MFKKRILPIYLTLAVPILLALAGVRLVMSPAFLYFEYTRPDFPEDIYGFTQADRLQYAPYALNYLLNGEDIDYLSSLRFPTGGSLYNANELRHMRDVKVITQYAYLFGTAILLGTLLAIVTLGCRKDSQPDLRRGIMNGSVLTLGIIVTIVAMAVISWDTFFTAFHTLFFESGTWRFAYSDTLIRLFPEQFWFDAALTIGVIMTLGAGTLWLALWRWGQLVQRA